MKTQRARLLLCTTSLALVTSASPLLAQRCLGIAMPRRAYIGAESRHAGISDGRQEQVYGGRLAYRFEAGAGVGLTVSLAGAGGPMHGDSTAVHLSGLIAANRTLPGFDNRLSACVAAGFEISALDIPASGAFADGDDYSLVSVPVTVGLGYDVPAGAWTITPFAAPSIARYAFETAQLAGGAEMRGWDGYVTLGASAAAGRWSVGANSRYGDRATKPGGRLTLRAGVSF